MKIVVARDKIKMGSGAAEKAAEVIRKAIHQKGHASIILATGASQFGVLENLVSGPGVDWSRVTLFHLDEYAGISEEHPASFRRYLKERFISRVPSLAAVHLLRGDHPDPHEECRRMGDIISGHHIDVALVGIGENGHLAFNDPPADFETKEPYIVVRLDEVCRRQQMGEGWFSSLAEVPETAISMSIRQIMKSATIICSVPDLRKAEAVRNCLENPVSNLYPASILQDHPDCHLFLDLESSSLLSGSYA
jgi:glucosamine-6-phosphate deaminase